MTYYSVGLLVFVIGPGWAGLDCLYFKTYCLVFGWASPIDLSMKSYLFEQKKVKIPLHKKLLNVKIYILSKTLSLFCTN